MCVCVIVLLRLLFSWTRTIALASDGVCESFWNLFMGQSL